jgi:PPOX class probable F420-dependent enzyme
LTPEEARARFEEIPVAHLATVGADGAPHLVPITFATSGETIYTAADAKPKGGSPLRRFRNVAANPRVSVLVDRYDPDWSRLWWARADGRARVVTDGDDLERALSALRARYPQYAKVALTGPAIVIAVERWGGWSNVRAVGG